jgi:mRNA interferase MazF
LALFCPITSRVTGYPFEIALSSGLAVSDVVFADQVLSLDWKARSAALVGRAPDAVVQDVLARLEPLVT